MGLQLKCLWNNDETDLLNQLGLPNDVDNYSTREVTFYRIDAISKNIAYGKPFCNVTVGGESWICVEDYDSVKLKIKQCKTI